MVKRFSGRQKSFKEKLKELKDLATGKKTLEALAEATRPQKIYIVEEKDGFYMVDHVKMTKEQYETWLAERPRDRILIDKIIVFRRSSLNEPIIEEDEKPLGLRPSADNSIDAIVWKETKTYSDEPPTQHVVEFHDYSEDKKELK